MPSPLIGLEAPELESIDAGGFRGIDEQRARAAADAGRMRVQQPDFLARARQE